MSMRRTPALRGGYDRPSGLVSRLPKREPSRHETKRVRAHRLDRVEVRHAEHAAQDPPSYARFSLANSRLGDHRIDVRKVAAEHPRRLDRFAVADQERRASATSCMPERLEGDVECAGRIAVPVGEERDLDPESLQPTRGATTASRARSRTAASLRRPDRRSCHAGGAARSFRLATSRRRRSRVARARRRAPAAAVAPPLGCRPRP